MAIDRAELVEKTLAGHGAATSLPVHPRVAGYDTALAREWDQDLERAAALLADGGWKANDNGMLERRGEPLSLRLIVNQDNTFKTAAAEEAAAALERLGCEVTVDRLSWEDFITALEKKEFDLFLGETALTPDFNLEPLLGQNGSLNYTGFADGETWEGMAQYRSTQGKGRMTTLVNLCGRIAELAPIVPLCFKNGSLLTQWGQVTGAAPVQRDVFAGIENWSLRHS